MQICLITDTSSLTGHRTWSDNYLLKIAGMPKILYGPIFNTLVLSAVSCDGLDFFFDLLNKYI